MAANSHAGRLYSPSSGDIKEADAARNKTDGLSRGGVPKVSRTYPERPIVGIGVVVVRDGRVLLIQRGKPPRRGQWSLPGGAQKLGETVFEAGKREVAEETGLELDHIRHLCVVDMIDRDDTGAVRYHYTLVDLVATSIAGEPVASSDAMAVRWVSLAEIEAMDLWQETKRVITVALEQSAPQAR